MTDDRDDRPMSGSDRVAERIEALEARAAECGHEVHQVIWELFGSPEPPRWVPTAGYTRPRQERGGDDE